MYMNVPKNRLFKWIGGKNWMKGDLCTTVDSSLEATPCTTYIEPFVGGMGAFMGVFDTLKKHNIDNIVLNDINPTVIQTYLLVKDNKDELIEELIKIEEGLKNEIPKMADIFEAVGKDEKDNTIYNDNIIKQEKLGTLHGVKDKHHIKVALEDAKDYFNKIKSEFNELRKTNDVYGIDICARFIFLMTHCFNGVYRENKSGGYNVPYNWSTNKNIMDGKIVAIDDYYNFFQENHITFENLDVFKLIEKYGFENNFYYLDPPYLNEHGGENNYSEDGFGFGLQMKLIEATTKMQGMAYSNHLLKAISDKFDEEVISYEALYRKNIMSASKKSRETDLAEILAWK